MGLGGVAIAVLPYVIHPKTAVLGRAGGMVLYLSCIFYLHLIISICEGGIWNVNLFIPLMGQF